MSGSGSNRQIRRILSIDGGGIKGTMPAAFLANNPLQIRIVILSNGVMIDALLNESREYCAARGISLTTLGLYACDDSKLFARLESGGQCMPRTIERVRKYMAEHWPDGLVVPPSISPYLLPSPPQEAAE